MSGKSHVGPQVLTVLSKIKRVLAVVRVLGISIRHNHLGEGDAIECATFLTLVIEGNVVQDDTLAVVEADMDLPFLPADCAAVDGKRYATGLRDVDGLDICAEATLCFDRFCVEIGGCSTIQRTPYLGNVNVNDLFRVGVEDGAKVEWEGVLAVVDVGAVVHESLLETDIAAEPLIITDGPC